MQPAVKQSTLANFFLVVSDGLAVTCDWSSYPGGRARFAMVFNTHQTNSRRGNGTAESRMGMIGYGRLRLLPTTRRTSGISANDYGPSSYLRPVKLCMSPPVRPVRIVHFVSELCFDGREEPTGADIVVSSLRECANTTGMSTALVIRVPHENGWINASHE